MLPSTTDHFPVPSPSRSSFPYRRLLLVLTSLFLLLILANFVVNRLMRGDAATYGLVQNLLTGLDGSVLLVLGGTVLIQVIGQKPRPFQRLAEGLYLLSLGGLFAFMACLPLLPAEQIGLIGGVWILLCIVLFLLGAWFRRAQQPE